jgi:thiol-disulfide isomerase/thioredoxin
MHKHISLLLIVLGTLALLTGCPPQKPAEQDATANGTTAADTPPPTANTQVPKVTPPEVELPAQRANTGNPATDFEYLLFDGTSHKLSENFGKPTVVNFWADWCPPCVAELPHFEEAWKAKGTQFNLIAIAVKDAQKPREFVQQQGWTMPFAIDVSGAQTYGVTGIPMTLFIDKSGNIVEKVVGGMDKDTFEKNLARIL